ncbi:MAG: toll/interleukin-1 receptor domain-containing protein, partial [Methyloceanibacter sp.]
MEQQSRLAEQRSNKPPDFAAFISHAKADQKKVQEIVGALEQRGFKCWVAPRDVRPGHSYGDEIIRGIERSRCFILALSKASNESPFVAREVERAISKRKPIFPLRIE